MRKGWFIVSFLLIFLAGCMAQEPLRVREEKFGKNTPVIVKSFAAKEIRPGETWKVYLEAKDEDGDMENIITIIEQPGVGTYPVSFTRIKAEDRKELSGYIHLFTAHISSLLNLTNLTLRIQIQDKAGHYSEPVIFPLALNTRYKQEPPPKDTFKEKDLGPIMIRLRTFQDGAGTGIEW